MNDDALEADFRRKSLALLVGIDTYVSPDLMPLKCAVRDVEAVEAALIEHCGFARANVKKLCNTQATRAMVLAELSNIAKETALCRRDDGPAKTRCIVYFAVHGLSTDRNNQTQTELAMHDTNPDVAYSGLGRQEIDDAMGKIAADQTLLIFDCCHAAGVYRGARASASAGSPSVVTAMRDAAGAAKVFSCRDGELAWEDREEHHSIFARALLEVLAPKPDTLEKPAGPLYLDGLRDHLIKRVPEIALRERNKQQTPEIDVLQTGGPLLVALRLGTAPAQRGDGPADPAVEVPATNGHPLVSSVQGTGPAGAAQSPTIGMPGQERPSSRPPDQTPGPDGVPVLAMLIAGIVLLLAFWIALPGQTSASGEPTAPLPETARPETSSSQRGQGTAASTATSARQEPAVAPSDTGSAAGSSPTAAPAATSKTGPGAASGSAKKASPLDPTPCGPDCNCCSRQRDYNFSVCKDPACRSAAMAIDAKCKAACK